jgi:hypothetical protein
MEEYAEALAMAKASWTNARKKAIRSSRKKRNMP